MKRWSYHFLASVLLGALDVVAVGAVDGAHCYDNFLQKTQLLPKAVEMTRIFGPLMMLLMIIPVRMLSLFLNLQFLLLAKI